MTCSLTDRKHHFLKWEVLGEENHQQNLFKQKKKDIKILIREGVGDGVG